jgi:hypothetical protein
MFTDYPVHCGREHTDSVDTDMGLQFTDAIKFCLASPAIAVKNDLLVSTEPDAYLSERNDTIGANEAHHRKTGRIADIRYDHGDRRDWCCLGRGRARDSRRPV